MGTCSPAREIAHCNSPAGTLLLQAILVAREEGRWTLDGTSRCSEHTMLAKTSQSPLAVLPASARAPRCHCDSGHILGALWLRLASGLYTLNAALSTDGENKLSGHTEFGILHLKFSGVHLKFKLQQAWSPGPPLRCHNEAPSPSSTSQHGAFFTMASWSASPALLQPFQPHQWSPSTPLLHSPTSPHFSLRSRTFAGG